MASLERRTGADGTERARVVWRTGSIKHRTGWLPVEAAEREQKIIEGDLARGLRYDPAKARTKFGVFAEKWYGLRSQHPDVQQTRKKERSYLDARILPRWRDQEMWQVENGDVRSWVNALEVPDDPDERPLAASTIRAIYSVFCSIMKQAEIDGYLPMGDPVGKNKVPLPRDGEDRRKFLTDDELDHLLDVTEKHFPEHYALVYVAAFTGMRQGELLALRRESYSPLGRFLDVHWSMHKSGHIGPTKGRQRRRVDFDRNWSTCSTSTWVSTSMIESSPGSPAW